MPKLGCLFLCFLLINGFNLSYSYAQSEANYWVYDVVETDTAYEIIRTNALDNSVESITEVPKKSVHNLSSIVPEAEMAAAEKWLTGTISDPVGSGVPNLLEYPPQSGLIQVVPSPDGTQVALNIVHSLCLGPSRRECFGVAQIVLIDIETGQQSILWSLPLQADSVYFPYCYPEYTYIDTLSVDTGIIEIRWTPDQTAIVARIGYESYAVRPDLPLIVIPINAPEKAVAVGNGEKGWAISSDSREVASLSLDCGADPRGEEAVRITQFDLNGNASYTDYSLGMGIGYLAPIFPTNYFRGQFIFPVTETLANSQADYTFRLAKLSDGDEMRLLEGSVSEISHIQTSLSGEVAVIEDKDGLLWQLLLDEDTFELQPITTHAVIYWQFASDSELVVQFEGDSQYSVIPIAYNT